LRRGIILVLLLGWMLTFNLCAEQEKEAEQNLADFSLSGLNQNGKKSWEIFGKSADMFSQTVNIKDMVARLYRDGEDIELKAKEADFDKIQGALSLKKDVIITTTNGATLTTDTLNWDRNTGVVSTRDRVDIQRNNIIASALGAFAQTDLKKVNLEKDVSVQINSLDKGENAKSAITITCDGPLQIDYEKNVAIFNNNVNIVKDDIQIYSDRLEIYFVKETKETKHSGIAAHQIEKIHALGNVRIIRNDNVSFSEEAIYDPQSRKIILTGKPKLIIYSDSEGFNAAFGN